MVGDSRDTVFSKPLNLRSIMLSPVSTSVAAAAETAITIASGGEYAFLLSLSLICRVASTTIGTWALKDAMGGTERIRIPQNVAVAAPGTRIQFDFDMPLYTNAQGAQFSLTPSVVTMGTWDVITNGFYSV